MSQQESDCQRPAKRPRPEDLEEVPPAPVVRAQVRSFPGLLAQLVAPPNAKLTFAYVPVSGDNVYEDAGVAAILVKGTLAALTPVHQAIVARFSAKDREHNNRAILRPLVRTALPDFFDGEEEEEEDGDKDDASMLQLLREAVDVTWDTTDALEDLFRKAVELEMRIPFSFVRPMSGLAAGSIWQK